MRISLYRAIDLLEQAAAVGDEDEIVTEGRDLMALVYWTGIACSSHPRPPAEVLDWLRTEAKLYEISMGERDE